MKTPRISVVMPVYNAEKHLEESISSILKQIYSDFEFIIINDGSTDRSVEIIESFTDSRIRLIHNDKNVGMTISLNKGIELSCGEFIARMDADDISLPNRFKKQIEFLDNNQDVGVLGTNCIAMNRNSKPKYKIHYPENHWMIMWALLFSNPLCHPGMMIRKKVFESFGYYDEDESKKYNQDYDLWTRLINYTKFHNLQDELLLLRTEGQKISTIHFDAQTDSTIKINQSHLSNYLGKEIPEKFIRGLWTWKFDSSIDIKEMVNIIKRTYDKFISDFKLSENITLEIRKDAARRMLLIMITKFYSPVLIPLYFKAIKLSPSSPFRTAVYGINAMINKYQK